jgi:hypothetical protein
MSDEINDKGVYASAEVWASIRSNAAFIELVRLARITNALALAYPPVLVSLEDQSPSARRDRFVAMAYAGSLIHEGLIVAQSLGKHFRDLKQYKEGFAELFGDEKVKRFRTQTLDRLRDELVFHVDRDSVAEGLQRFPEGETLIATATEFRQGEIYFDLADEIVLGYLFGQAETQEQYFAEVGTFIEQIADLLNRYMRASHSLIPAALREMGCYVKPFRRPDSIPDDAG